MTPRAVYLAPSPTVGPAIHRVARMLEQYAPPTVRVVPLLDYADFRIWHAFGPGEFDAILNERLPYAMVQYNVITSQYDPLAWVPLWKRSRAVWSYLPLPLEDPVVYHAPLGVDCSVFKPCGCAKQYLVGTSGYIAETETVGEWSDVVKRLSARQFHLGPDLGFGSHVDARTALTDAQLAKRWAMCRFVSGLRRVEGFEFPAYEGLACGARPVMYDRPDARAWMGDHAYYINETGFDDVVSQLVWLAEREPWPVTPAERSWVRETFDWSRLVAEFWTRVLS